MAGFCRRLGVAMWAHLFLIGLAAVAGAQAGEMNVAHRMLQMSAMVRTGTSASSSGGGTSSASVTATSKGGLVEGFVSANSEAITDVTNDLVVIINRSIEKVEDDVPVALVVQEEAQAIGTAVAEAYASILIDGFSEGSSENQFCASAAADAQATATAFAEAYAEAIVKACAGEVCADASADASAIASVTANAFAQSSGEGCIEGQGTIFASQETLATSIGTAYASALTSVLAEVRDGEATAGADSTATSTTDEDNTASSTDETMVTGDSTVTVQGEGGASTQQNKACENPFDICCTRANRRRDSCTCRGIRCKMSRIDDPEIVLWNLTAPITSGTSSNPKEFDAGFMCFCSPN